VTEYVVWWDGFDSLYTTIPRGVLDNAPDHKGESGFDSCLGIIFIDLQKLEMFTVLDLL